MEDQEIEFMDLRLLPGQVIYLEFEGYTRSRDKSILVGYRRKGSIIVTMPVENGVPIPVKNGEKVNARLFVGKRNSACAFQTEVMFSSNIPYHHVHLKVPEKVVVDAVRKSVRAEVEVVSRLVYNLGENEKRTTAKILDLSTDGARIAGRTFEFKNGDHIRLEFDVNVSGIEVVVETPGIVRSLGDIDKGKTAGIQFDGVDDLHKIAIQAFVLSQVH
ncbi:flagellar brake domain-containing protein [Bermanella sp. R86510]|uniref:flagellar brake domain-containing protein n=1 Tax=unclassified Bermanella TaxID=2627862 RepID=UPI0037C50A72